MLFRSPTARVVSVTKLSDTKVRLYVASDNKSNTAYSTSNVLQNAKFDQNGTYSSNTAFGTYANTATQQVYLSGRITASANGTSSTLPGGGTYVTGANTVTFNNLASSTNDFYTGAQIVIYTTNQVAVTNKVKVGST